LLRALARHVPGIFLPGVTSMSQSLYQRYLYFKAHSASVTPPGLAACALSLAKAEIAAAAAGLEYVYKFDSEPSWALGADGEYHAFPAFIVRLVLEDEDEQRTVLASIGSVEADADSAFYRVSEAQLAEQAMSELVAAVA
jgi:hypothetical protein